MLGYLMVEVVSDRVLRLSRNEKVGGNHSSSCGGKVHTGGVQQRRLNVGGEINPDLNCIDLN